MWSSILQILGGAFQGIGAWISSYSSKDNTKARVENDKTDKKDQLNEAIKDHDVDTERKLLG